MIVYVLRRIAWAVPTLLLVSLAVFALIRLIPGDPARLMLGDTGGAEQVAAIRHTLGLDLPLPLQFLHWLDNAVRGDLGRSVVNKLPVLPLVLGRAAVSATVVFVSIGVAVFVALPLGLLAAWKQNSVVDLAVVFTAAALMSIPSFWLGLMLLLLFGVEFRWFPVVGYVPFSQDFREAAWHIALPAATLATVECGGLLRMVRASAIEVLRLDYVTHARAKGIPEWKVLCRHVLPNAFGPVWTLVGLVFGNLLGGIAVLETVFTLPGLGKLLIDSIFARDYPVIQGCLLFTAFAYVAVNLVVDLVYPVFDPRLLRH